MSTDVFLLERAAADGTFDSSEWPRVHAAVLDKIDQIIYNEFEIPSIPKSGSPVQPSTDAPSSDSSKPNDDVKDLSERSSPPARDADASTSAEPSTQPAVARARLQTQAKLPPRLQASYDYVKTTLETQFATHPPHTIQRLAELVLRPKEHYRFLHQFLNALDRVVSVSSGLDSFPLPVIEGQNGSTSLVNGTNSTQGTLGSDESLGGALLTPIPWLRDRGSGSSSPIATSFPSNGATLDTLGEGAIDDAGVGTEERLRRESGAVTQGELLRLEQEHSDPPAPVASAPTRSHVIPAQAASTGSPEEMEVADDETSGEDQEQPHARGPETIGLEDTGPMDHAVGVGQVLDMEAAVGRLQSPPRKSPEGLSAEANEGAGQYSPAQEDDTKDDDGDVVLADADGVTEEEERRGEDRRNEVTIGVDTTAQ